MERKTRLSHLATLQETGHVSRMDVEQSGSVRCGLLSRIHQMHDFPLLVLLEFWSAVIIACAMMFVAWSMFLGVEFR